MNYNIDDFVRTVGSLGLTQKDKNAISEYVIKTMGCKKELSGKHIAVASFAAVVVVGVFCAIKGHKQDKFDVR